MRHNRLLITDLHLTDNELETYRWKVFEFVEQIAIQNNVDEIHILGDMTDRKDRHTGNLLNRVVKALVELHENTGAEIFILQGNHDAPLQGTSYWDFLNKLGIYYVIEPRLHQSIWLLPFSANPLEDWRDYQLFNADVLMMHQTIAGALIERDATIKHTPHPMPILPRGVPIYSGDIHRPQRVGGITYVGASHPVRFGEDWRCRCLLIKNDDWTNPIEIYLPHIRRQILDIDAQTNAKDLDYLKQDDQIRIRYHLTKSALSDWPLQQEILRDWARSKQIKIVSMESILEDVVDTKGQCTVIEKHLASPEQILRDFCLDQKLDALTLNEGLELIQELS